MNFEFVPLRDYLLNRQCSKGIKCFFRRGLRGMEDHLSTSRRLCSHTFTFLTFSGTYFINRSTLLPKCFSAPLCSCSGAIKNPRANRPTSGSHNNTPFVRLVSWSPSSRLLFARCEIVSLDL